MYLFLVYSVYWDYYTLIISHMFGALLEELELHTPHVTPKDPHLPNKTSFDSAKWLTFELLGVSYLVGNLKFELLLDGPKWLSSHENNIHSGCLLRFVCNTNPLVQHEITCNSL